MRLAQIARKVGKTPQEIARFLNEQVADPIEKDPNFKLTDDQVNAVMDEFEAETIVETEVKPSKMSESDKIMPDEPSDLNPTDESIEHEIATETVDANEETAAKEEDVPADEIETSVEAFHKEEDVESTPSANPSTASNDDEDEDSESETFFEAEVDPDAELIQAPKIKLDGLKILGKIELPEDKKPVVEEKTEAQIAEEEAGEIAALDAAMASQAQDIKPKGKSKTKTSSATAVDSESEYKDKNGVYHFSPQQKANRERRLREINREQKRIAEKERKRLHYEQKVQKKTVDLKDKERKKKDKKTAIRQSKKKEEKVAPKGLWQKFVHWLND